MFGFWKQIRMDNIYNQGNRRICSFNSSYLNTEQKIGNHWRKIIEGVGVGVEVGVGVGVGVRGGRGEEGKEKEERREAKE